ncbi:MAG: type IV pilus assembly protein PilM [Deferribacteraceae bacterium]|jgi:type IV pilus assembly protein PilM|nr:type IV pilus assembly protein PilM [Deferribacteraceae bacterium]
MAAAGGGRYVGFDIGSYSIKAVEVTGKADKLSLSGIYMMPTPDDTINDGDIVSYGELSEHIVKVYSSGGFVSKSVAVAVKGRDTFAKSVTIPYVNQDQLNMNLHFMAEQYMCIEMEEYAVDYQVLNLNKTNATAHVLFAATRNSTIADYMGIFKDAQLELRAVDVEVIALANLYSYMQLSANDTTMIMHIGKDTVYYIFMDRGLFSYYEIGSSGGDLLSNVLIEKGNVAEDALEVVKAGLENNPDMLNVMTEDYFPSLMDEMELAINHYMLLGGRPPEKVYLSGGGASMGGLRPAVQAKFSVASTVMNPSSHINIVNPTAAQIIEQNPGILNVAIAMALR